MISLDDLWGRDAAWTHEQLRTARSCEDRFAIAENALARHHDARWVIDAEVTVAWRQMPLRHGRARIERLAADLAWSRKRLWSRFQSQIGLTPKRAAELIRFDSAAHRLASGHGAARVAAECGYVDQSHLHREVTAFARVSPMALADAPFLAVDDVAWPSRAGLQLTDFDEP